MITVCRVPLFGTFYTKEVSKPLNNQTPHFPTLGILQVGRATSIARCLALPAFSHHHFCSVLAKMRMFPTILLLQSLLYKPDYFYYSVWD